MPRVLQVLNHLNRGGQEKLVVDFFKNFDKRYKFIFLAISEKGPYAFAEDILRSDGRIHYLPLNSRHRIKKEYKKQFERLIRDERIDIIHIHPKADYIAKFARQHNIPFAVHSHSTFFKLPTNTICKIIGAIRYKVLVRSRLRKADALLACSDTAGKFLFGSKPFHIIPNGIPLNQYRFRESRRLSLRKKYAVNPGDTVVLHVGRMAYPKNQSFVIDVFKEYLSMNSRARLFLVGDGPDKMNIEAKVSALNLDKYVTFLGSVDSKPFYNLADIFILPSLSEGLAISLIEAQANGLRCITSVAVTKEVDVTNTITFLPEASSSSEWAQAISEKAGRRFDGAKIMEASPYNIRYSVRKLEYIYETLLEHVRH